MNERLKEIRIALEMTRAEFAEKLNVGGNYIYMVESGTRPVSDHLIMDVCREYGVNEFWLRIGEGEMFISMSKEQEVAKMASVLLKEPEGSIRYRIAKKVLMAEQQYIDAFEALLTDILGGDKL